MSTTKIKFFNSNNNFVNFQADQDLVYELRSKFSFYAPSYKWDKRYKAGYWDGKISLINVKDRKVYAGLLPKIKQYLDEEGVEYQDNSYLVKGKPISFDQAKQFYVDKINGKFIPHDEQVTSLQNCISLGRNIIIAPTSLGKSYIIHALNAYYKFLNKRVLLIVDRAQLVLQLKKNFVEEYDSGQFYTTSTIYDDNINTDVVITTWQSIVDNPKSWFEQFDVIIGDEVHKFKAKSLIKIVEMCDHIEYRHGFTATLDNDSKVDGLTLIGLFGSPFTATTLKKQIEKGISVRPIVYVVVIKYGIRDRLQLISDIKDEIKKAQQQGKKNTATIPFLVESKFIEQHEQRNQLIIQLAQKQVGNTLVAFKNESHGRLLYENLKKCITHPIFFSSATVSKDKRFAIQLEIEKLSQSTAAVSFGTFSTGINIPNLHNLIITSQLKSEITIPQLIGRMIRNFTGKNNANIIEICDDLSHNSKKNIFFTHFEHRMKFYLKNNFEIKTKVVTI